MNKKFAILIIIVILLLVLGGVFCLWWGSKTSDVYRYSKPGNYIIKDDLMGRIVENAAAGLVIKILDGWKAKVGDIGGDGVVSFYCPNTELFANGALKEGCLIQAEVLDCSRKDSMAKVDLDQTQHIINALLSGSSLNKGESQKYKIRGVSGYKALEEISTQKIDGREIAYISIKVPVEEKLYEFNVLLVPPTPEKYSQFEILLDTVSIK